MTNTTQSRTDIDESPPELVDTETIPSNGENIPEYHSKTGRRIRYQGFFWKHLCTKKTKANRDKTQRHSMPEEDVQSMIDPNEKRSRKRKLTDEQQQQHIEMKRKTINRRHQRESMFCFESDNVMGVEDQSSDAMVKRG